MLFNCGIGDVSWESLGKQGDQTSQSERKSTQNTLWKVWCWSWSSNTLATWCEEPTHWKRPWCWERLKTGEESDRGEMDEWYRWCNGHEHGQTLGDGEGQRSLACCRSCGHKELDTTRQLNNNMGEEAAFKVCFSLIYYPVRPPVLSQFPEPFHLASLHCIFSSLAFSCH